MNELPTCLRCDASYASVGALRCATCFVEPDLVAIGAIEMTEELQSARRHRPKTQWPFASALFGALTLVPLGFLLQDDRRKTGVLIACLLMAALFGGITIYAIANLLRKRPATPATIVGLAEIPIATSDGSRTTLRITLAFADGSVRPLVAAPTMTVSLDATALGTRVIAFADDDMVYDVWPVT